MNRTVQYVMVVSCVFLQSINFGLLASPCDDNITKIEFSNHFSPPTFINERGFISIGVTEANSLLIRDHKPLVPMATSTFTFPFGTQIRSITCKPKDIIEKQLAKAPTPSPIAFTTGATYTETPVGVYHNISNQYPESWYEFAITTGLNGQDRVVSLTIYVYPVRYHFPQNEVSCAREVDIKIEYEIPIQNHLFQEEHQFIILSADKYTDDLDSFVSHKINRGLSTIVVSLSEVFGGTYFPPQGRDDQEKIKYFIKNAIENWGTSYVMLVGNRDTFPMRETHVYMDDPDRNKFVSDLYYADIYDGQGAFATWDTNENDIFGEFHETDTKKRDDVDLQPDVHLGRLAINNENELSIVLSKFMRYENLPAYTKDWFTNIVTIGGDSFIDDTHDPDAVFEGEIVNEAVIKIMDGFIPERIWVSLGKLTSKSALNNALNQGVGFVDFSGHGNTNVWATHPHKNENVWLPGPNGGYFSSDIQNLGNEDKLPIIITGACSVSKFNKDENCFSWSWLKSANGGGIATFGATALGYAYISTYVTYGLVEKIAIETFDAYDNGAITVGEMWTEAINSYLRGPGLHTDGDYKTVEEWQLFGDPTLAIGDESQSPSKPDKPIGSSNGKAGVEYTYQVTTTDPDGDKIYYLLDWGDGTFSGWVGPYFSGQKGKAKHIWNKRGNYEIKVKAKDIHGKQSEWSDSLAISMPKSRAFDRTYLQLIFEHLIEQIPFIKKIRWYLD